MNKTIQEFFVEMKTFLTKYLDDIEVQQSNVLYDQLL